MTIKELKLTLVRIDNARDEIKICLHACLLITEKILELRHLKFISQLKIVLCVLT